MRPSPTRTAVLLHEYVALHSATPFSWQAHCCHWAAGWVRHATGTWPMQGLPDTPTLHAARRLMRQLGGSLAAAWTQRLGRPALPAAMAQLGDVVRMPLQQPGLASIGEAVGVCNGAHVLVLGPHGHPDHVPLAACTHAWRLWPDPENAPQEAHP